MSLTDQARFDKSLPEPITINEIAGSWITKDRLPVVTVTRNYETNTSKINQVMQKSKVKTKGNLIDFFLEGLPA